MAGCRRRRREEAAAAGRRFIDDNRVLRDRARDRLRDRGVIERAGRLISSGSFCGFTSAGLACSTLANSSSAATEFSPQAVMRFTSQPSGFNRLGLFG